MIGQLPKSERDIISIYCFNVRMRNAKNKRYNSLPDTGGNAVIVASAGRSEAPNPDDYVGGVVVRGGVYRPLRACLLWGN